MCIRDRYQRRVHGVQKSDQANEQQADNGTGDTPANKPQLKEKQFSEVLTEQQETAQDFQLDQQLYESTSADSRRRLYVYVGDQKGFIHVWHLTDILKRRDIVPQKEEKKKQSFQLRRKDLINAKKYIENILSSQERKNDQKPLQVHAYGSVLIKRWQPHTSTVTKLVKVVEIDVQNPKTICNVSCSTDKQVKLWNSRGQALCKLNLIKFDQKDFQWNFPFDWIRQKLNDIELVFDSLLLIENEKLNDQEKDKIRMKFLINKFFTPTTMEDLQKEIMSREQKNDVDPNPKEEKPKYTYTINKDAFKYNRPGQFNTYYESRDVDYMFKDDRNSPENEDGKKNKASSKYEPKPFQMSEQVKELADKLDQRIGVIPPDRQKKTQITQNEKEQISKEKHYKIQSKTKNFKKLQLQASEKKLSRAEDEALFQKIAPSSTQYKFQTMGSKPQTSSSQMRKRNLLTFSIPNLLKNNAYVNNLVKGSRPTTQNSDKYQFVKDVKYKNGESKRQIRMATNLYVYKLAADSPNIIFGDNEVLQRKNKFYKELNQPYKNQYKDKHDFLEDEEEDEKQNFDPKKKGIKIVASANFLYNPNRNKHKILQAKDKIYVIEQ
eukprot:TRINITY_DN11359_c0_g1_i3.p1 TRINITY_DN11359_c0_g1~~TRINITY_DN11359_c0_g1_i3.p1  ORF type:complete len:606 (+),score=123.98 TRINITY_DN11359_c0_g1_i3:77-1894(+)